MKWFKHFAMAHADDKLVSIRAHFGMWGVGTYWTLVERVAEQMRGANPSPTATVLVPELCSFLGCKRNKLVSFLDHLQNIRGMKHKLNGDILEINIPKLLEIKDNYQKDLEETSQRLPSKEEEVEVEEEGEVEEDKSYCPSVGTEANFQRIWEQYPSRTGRKNALRHFKATVKGEKDFSSIQIALQNYVSSGNVKKGYIKNGSTWFNEWQDWVHPTEQMMRGNGGKTNSNSNSQTARAGFKHGPDEIKRLRDFEATLEQRIRDKPV